jgi:hypothetical protein
MPLKMDARSAVVRSSPADEGKALKRRFVICCLEGVTERRGDVLSRKLDSVPNTSIARHVSFREPSQRCTAERIFEKRILVSDSGSGGKLSEEILE